MCSRGGFRSLRFIDFEGLFIDESDLRVFQGRSTSRLFLSGLVRGALGGAWGGPW